MDLVLIGTGITLIAGGLAGQHLLRRHRQSRGPDHDDRWHSVAISLCTGLIVAGGYLIAITVVRAIL